LECGARRWHVNHERRPPDSLRPMRREAKQVGKGLGELFSSPNAPEPQDVADAVAKLVATPAGQRPDRVVVDNLTGNPIRAVNEAHVTQRRALMTAFGMSV